jgi:methionyl-tRNA formyltransferase
MARIAFAGSKTTTAECIQRFIRDGFSADLLVTLTPELGARHDVAGYADLRPLAAEHGIPVHHPRTYALDDEEDRAALLEQRIDCLLVIGWQRLIPSWWLERLTFGAFGMHGSHEPLPRGRGRSPLNWALAWGKTSFQTHLFRYDAGVDSGAIVGGQRFDITAWDDCATLHFKNTLSMSRLLRQHLPEILAGRSVYTPQPTDIEPTYLPKRTPGHGRIRWSDVDMLALHNHIRCQTRPFPGAFSHLDGKPERFYFWRGHPFDSHLLYPDARPGTVVEAFHDGSFLVAVWDGTVHVDDYTVGGLRTAPPIGSRFVDQPHESPPGA